MELQNNWNLQYKYLIIEQIVLKIRFKIITLKINYYHSALNRLNNFKKIKKLKINYYYSNPNRLTNFKMIKRLKIQCYYNSLNKLINFKCKCYNFNNSLNLWNNYLKQKKEKYIKLKNLKMT